MARPLRIQYPGAWYHVMNRGAGRRDIFPDEALRQSFLDLVADLYERYDAHCHAFCLMGSHYHLLVQTLLPNLARAMRHLDGVYTQRHNRRVKTDGPLFRGRYKAQLIEDGDYLWTVSRYIHRNPLEAGLCNRPADYKWSSFRYYDESVCVPHWFCTDRTIRQFGNTRAYCRFVDNESDPTQNRMLLSPQQVSTCPAILGTKEFVEQIMADIDEHCEIPQTKCPLSASAVVRACCHACGWEHGDLTAAENSDQRQRRAIVMTAARDYAGIALRDIAQQFGMNYPAVAAATKRCRIAASRDALVNERLIQLRGVLRGMRNVQT